MWEDIHVESMRPLGSMHRPALGRHHRAGIPAAAAKVLATPVDVVVPLQRHSPRLVLAASLAELATFGILIGIGTVGAMIALFVCSAVLLGVVVTNTRRVLVLTSKGNVLLTASATGWPNGVVGPAGESLRLPAPAGMGVTLTVGSATWWIDRSSYRWLSRARSMQGADATG
jgi:hypothetical protein